MKNKGSLMVLVLISFLLFSNLSLASVVDPHGSGDHTSIQAAIDAASPGDVVFINAGSYDETLVIDRPLTLIGAGMGSTVIDRDGSGNIITITSDNVTLSNLSITGSGSSVAALYINGVREVIISQVEIYGSQGNGSAVLNCNNISILGCKLHNNSYSGLILDSSQNVSLQDCALQNNYNGMLSAYCSNLSVIGNIADLNQNYGFFFNHNHYSSIQENLLFQNGNKGMQLSNSQRNDVSDNYGIGNSYSSIYLRLSDNNNLHNNTASGGQHGFALELSSDNTLVDNEAFGNDKGLYVRNSSQHNLFQSNHIHDNVNWSVMISSADNNTFLDNYLVDNRVGVFSYGSSNNTYESNRIDGNTVSGFSYYDIGSNDNRILNNSLRGNGDGMRLYSSTGGSVEGNEVLDCNGYGIRMQSFQNLTVKHNNLSGNSAYAIHLSSSQDVQVFGNNIVNGSALGYDDGANSWDDGYPGGGNYWGNYTGTDMFHGPGQDLPTGDGFGDTPSVLDGSLVTDRYPRMLPWFLDEEAPVADAGDDQLVEQTFTVTFNGTNSTDNVGIVNYTWTFLDVVAVSLYGAVTEYQFNNAGVYLVTLTVWDAAGNSDSDDTLMNLTVAVSEDPRADAGPDQIVDMGDTVTFDGSNSTDNVLISNYSWLFQDDSSVLLHGLSPSYIFQHAGVYVVTLVVTDSVGNNHTDDMTVTVRDTEPPVAVAGTDQEVAQGSMLTFNGSSSTDNVGIVNYIWTFHDLVPVTYHGMSWEHFFCNAGTVNITLNVSDAAGNWHEDVLTVTVLDSEDPVALMQCMQNWASGAKVQLQSWGSHDNITGIGSGIVNYTWSIWDGEETFLFYGENSSFSGKGGITYEITLTVSDAYGNTNSSSVELVVQMMSVPPMDLNLGLPWWLIPVLALMTIIIWWLYRRSSD